MEYEKFEVGDKVVLRFHHQRPRHGTVKRITPTGRYVVSVICGDGVEDIYNFREDGRACGSFWIDRPRLDKEGDR